MWEKGDALMRSVNQWRELKSSSDTELDPEKRALFTFKSKRARIDGLELKMERLREQLTKGLVRAPVEGRVIKKRRFTGEFAKQGRTRVGNIGRWLSAGKRVFVAAKSGSNRSWTGAGCADSVHGSHGRLRSRAFR